MRALAVLALLAAVCDASAQGTKAADTKTAAPVTKQAPTKQAPATKQDAKAGTPAPTTKVAAPATQTKAAATQAKGAAQQRPALTVAPEAAPIPKVPVIMREVFEYDAAGRRDPFVSLLTTTELRPTVADLRLVIVLFDPSGRRPVAVMRDLTTNTQYRVTTGMTLGRMRVSEIKRRSVIFTIEEFGLNRQDSLVLGDTTKARAR